MDRISLGHLLEIVDFEVIIELCDSKSRLILRAPVEEVLLQDKKLLDRNVMIFAPQHNQRENYLDITLYD